MNTQNQESTTQVQGQNQEPTPQTTQTTQATSNSQSGVVFDINNLPPEFVRYVDQQRTKASQTARNNARKELMEDEEFLNTIKGNIAPQVEKTTEEKFHDQLTALSLRAAKSEVRTVLTQGGIKGEDVDTYVNMFATEDVDASIEKATQFVSAFNNTLQSRMNESHQKDLLNMATPQTGSTSPTEKETLQAQLNEARKDTSFYGPVKVSSIIRIASEKGIKLE